MMEDNQNQIHVSEAEQLTLQPDPQMVSTVTAAVLQTLQATGALPSKDEAPTVSAQPEVKNIDLTGLFFTILEKFWLVMACAVAGVLFMWWIAGYTNTYTATAKLYIVDVTSGSINIAGVQLGTALTLDYQEVFKTGEVHEMVIEELGLPYTYGQMQSMITVSNPKDTRILYITVTHPDAKMAADIANAYAKAAKTFIIDTMRGGEPSDFSIALVPSVDDSESKISRIVLGIMLGSVTSVGVITLLFVLDHRPRSPEAIKACGGIPTLAVFPARHNHQKAQRDGINNRSPGKLKQAESPAALRGAPYLEISDFPDLDFASREAMNILCTDLSYCGLDIRRVMITSRYAGEGNSYVCMNLMRAMAQLGRRVVLVDTDLRAPSLQADYCLRFGMEKHYGLSEYLSGLCNRKDVIYQTNISGAYMIPAGHETPTPLELLDTEQMHQLIEWLGSQFDMVIVDTPPAGVLADAVALAKFCNGALLVVGYRTGNQNEISDVVRHIRQTGCKMLGAVLNGVRFDRLSNKYHYYSSERYASYYCRRSRYDRKAK